MQIEDIEPIESCSIQITHRKQLYSLVELPCLEAYEVSEAFRYFVDRNEGVIWDSQELAEKHSSHVEQSKCDDIKPNLRLLMNFCRLPKNNY